MSQWRQDIVRKTHTVFERKPRKWVLAVFFEWIDSLNSDGKRLEKTAEKNLWEF